MKLKEFSELLRTAVESGTAKALAKANALPEFLTKAEAYRQYGRSDVDRWLAEGLLHTAADRGKNQKKCIDRKKLEAIAAASNRKTYLPVAER
jgi:hypothetical protein